jgi:hypothetical protein
MIKQLREKGYKCPLGIPGHIENEDVKKVLERNIEGFNKILNELEKD